MSHLVEILDQASFFRCDHQWISMSRICDEMNFVSAKHFAETIFLKVKALAHFAGELRDPKNENVPQPNQ